MLLRVFISLLFLSYELNIELQQFTINISNLFSQVHVITLPDNSSDIVCEGLYTHQNEIWDLAICPFEPQIISTVYASGQSFYVATYSSISMYDVLGLAAAKLQVVTVLHYLGCLLSFYAFVRCSTKKLLHL